MTSHPESKPDWGNQYRLVASEKWKAKSAAMGQPVTDALVEFAQPAIEMRVLDLASGTGEPAISLASTVGEHGHVTALDLSADLLEIAAGARTPRPQELHDSAGRRAQPAFSRQQFRSCDLALRRDVLPRTRSRSPRTAPRVATWRAGMLSRMGSVRPALLAEHDGRSAPPCGRTFAAARWSGSFPVRSARQPVENFAGCWI